jgi:hypothetical protein
MEFAPDPEVPDFRLDKNNAKVIMSLTGSKCKVGKSGVKGKDVKIETGNSRQYTVLTAKGKRRLANVRPVQCAKSPQEKATLGTIQSASQGTAALLGTDDPERLVNALNGRAFLQGV